MDIRLLPDQRRTADGVDGRFFLPASGARSGSRLISSSGLGDELPAADGDHDTVEDLVPPGVTPRLRVVRGRKINAEYSLKMGPNYIGRRDDTPIEVDLEDQEPAERIWTSRKHAVLHFDVGSLEIEDLNSLNGTFVNRMRVAPGERRQIRINDILQVGTIQLRVVA